MRVEEETPVETDENVVPNAPEELPNICKACCVRVAISEEKKVQCTPTAFLRHFSKPFKTPPNFTLIAQSTGGSLTEELRTVPTKCCYVCAGILQQTTILKLVDESCKLLVPYKEADSLVINCTRLDLLSVRSYLCGLGKVTPSMKNVLKWLLMESITDRISVEEGKQDYWNVPLEKRKRNEPKAKKIERAQAESSMKFGALHLTVTYSYTFNFNSH